MPASLRVLAKTYACVRASVGFLICWRRFGTLVLVRLWHLPCRGDAHSKNENRLARQPSHHNERDHHRVPHSHRSADFTACSA